MNVCEKTWLRWSLIYAHLKAAVQLYRNHSSWSYIDYVLWNVGISSRLECTVSVLAVRHKMWHNGVTEHAGTTISGTRRMSGEEGRPQNTNVLRFNSNPCYSFMALVCSDNEVNSRSIRSAVFCCVKICSLLEIYRRFGGVCSGFMSKPSEQQTRSRQLLSHYMALCRRT
jgi:hypothetical protein